LAITRESTLSSLVPLPDLEGTRIAVTGAGGQLGRYLVPAARSAGAKVLAMSSRPGAAVDVAVDLTDSVSTTSVIRQFRPDIIIHAAACTDVDGIEREPVRGIRGNQLASHHVAIAAQGATAYLLAVSTDMVFSGTKDGPYCEHDATAPISQYGRSKLAAEQAVLGVSPAFGVARTSWLYGGAGKHFPRTVLSVLRDRGSIEVVDDEVGSPTFAGDLAIALLFLAKARGAGNFHLANGGEVSRYGLARETARLAGLGADSVKATTTEAFLRKYPLPALRPPSSPLLNTRGRERGATLPGWMDGLRRYVPALATELGLPGLGSSLK
jgi:dTDP-4-dehydrorhamnose reductase